MSEGALFYRSSFNLEGVIQAHALLHFAFPLGLQLRVPLQVSGADVERRTFQLLNGVVRAWFYRGVGNSIFRLSLHRAQSARS